MMLGFARLIDRCWLFLRSIFRGNDVDHELDQELTFHFDQQVDELTAAGMSHKEALLAAKHATGAMLQIKEQCRDERRTNLIENTIQDLRYAARTMRRSPVFTMVAILSLALGIGANTAIFSVIDRLMLKRLPVKDPDHLLMFSIGNYRNFGYRWFETFRDRLPMLDGIAATASFDQALEENDDSEQVRVALVSGSYFDVLGVNAAIGKAIDSADDRTSGTPPVAVISDGFWHRKFAGSTDVLGHKLKLDGVAYTILGVAPGGFTGDWIARPADVWVPAAMATQVASVRSDAAMVQQWRILARLKPGESREQAAAAATVINLQLHQEDAKRRGMPISPRIAAQRIDLASASHGFAPERKSVAQPLTILMAVSGLVLLIACANVASLLLARSAVRQREIAVKLAFGAARSRIVRQVLTESLALSLIGGALGILIAQSATGVLLKMVSSALVPVRVEITPDVRMLGFALGLSVLTGLLFGLAPARNASRVSVLPTLSGARDSSPTRLRLGTMLVISQVALSLLLVVGAGLFIRTLRNLKSQDFGLDRPHLLAIYTAPQSGRKNAAANGSYGKILDRIASLARVESVSEIGGSVLDPGFYWVDDSAAFRIQGQPLKNGQRVTMSGVGPGFFSTVGARMLAGRDFVARDANLPEPATAIINQTFARFYFGDENPIGHRIGKFGCIGAPCEKEFPFEIIGVVTDINHISPRFEHVAMAYLPMAADSAPGAGHCIVVRTLDPAGPGWGTFIRRQMHEVAPNVSVLRVLTIEQQLDETLAAERLIAALCAAFGALGVALASIGLYGVIAYTTSRRTHEIGVRIALGASRADVLEMVLKEGITVVLIGILAGIPLTLAATRLIAKWMYGIGVSDPATIVISAGIMIAVALLAVLIPARRAARVDPMVALRYE
jgi:predicted permease